MGARLQPIAYLLGAMAVVVADSSYSNGRSSPRGADMVLTTALCMEELGGAGRELYRARLMEGSGGSLSVRLGGGTQEVSIASIREIRFDRGSADSSGYAPATIVTEYGSTEKAAVRVSTPGGALHLHSARRERCCRAAAVQDDLLFSAWRRTSERPRAREALTIGFSVSF